MSEKRIFLLVVLLAAVCSGSLLAQTRAVFVSRDGGFTIDLPRTTTVGLQPIGIMSNGGNSYEWDLPKGHFTVSYIEGSFPPDQAVSALNSLANAVVAEQRDVNGKLTARREFSVDGNPAVELHIERPDAHAVNRFILVRNKLYVLTADWTSGTDGNAAVKILDSFALVDSAMLIA